MNFENGICESWRNVNQRKSKVTNHHFSFWSHKKLIYIRFSGPKSKMVILIDSQHIRLSLGNNKLAFSLIDVYALMMCLTIIVIDYNYYCCYVVRFKITRLAITSTKTLMIESFQLSWFSRELFWNVSNVTSHPSQKQAYHPSWWMISLLLGRILDTRGGRECGLYDDHADHTLYRYFILRMIWPKLQCGQITRAVVILLTLACNKISVYGNA